MPIKLCCKLVQNIADRKVFMVEVLSDEGYLA